jgi:drug/metabolite transporter (DMT)-like permease
MAQPSAARPGAVLPDNVDNGRVDEEERMLAYGAVLLSAVCSGTATILQAGVARRLPTANRLDAGLLLRLLRRAPYLTALALLVAGLLLAIFSLRTLPLYLVQSVRSSSLGVTALLSVLVLKQRLIWSELAAVAAVVVGIVLLALTSGPQEAADVGNPTRFAMLAAVAVLGLAAVPAARQPPGMRSGVTLGIIAGLCLAVLVLGARILRGFAPLTLLADPGAWAMGFAGLLGLLLSATAMQRASVVTVTAATVATEAVAAALLGLAVCGDRPLAGTEAYAVVGFALALAGALGLARFGAPAEEEVAGPRP